jgi:YD repeat-containing protein
MLRTLATALFTTALAVAQTCPSYNQYPLRLVDALGQPVPTTYDGYGNPVAQFATNNVYLAFDSSLPDGLYRFYVYVTDGPITVIASTDPYQNRVVDVMKVGNVVSMSFPLAISPVETGLGYNGFGQSLKLSFTSSVNPTSAPCHWKAWAGTGFPADPISGLPIDPNNPYQVQPGGTYPDCRVASYHHFDVIDCGGTPTNCFGHTIGFWGNSQGKRLVTQYGLLTQYAALNLVRADGSRAAPFASVDAYAAWLRQANATNMAFMLSAQLVATYNSVAVGNVSRNCRLHHPVLGNLTIDQLMALAVASLATDPLTLSGHAARAFQTQLKDALDAANNNVNWGWL